jgi:arsenite methyltransferase
MSTYLSYQFHDSESFIETFDELPLWSASFGLLLLKHLELRRNMTVVDIGSGAGFPLLELAARMGDSCKVFGVDPWVNANQRARKKIRNYGLNNVEIHEGSAEKMPFAEHFADLLVSNLGINNFENPGAVFAECARVLKPKGRLALTTNLNGHWKEFYHLFGEALKESGHEGLVPQLISHQEHRGSVGSISKMFEDCGMKVTRHFEEHFEMKFTDGTAFLNHHFVKLGWLSSWRNMLPEAIQQDVFSLLEKKMNAYAETHGCLVLTVPMAFIEGEKA